MCVQVLFFSTEYTMGKKFTKTTTSWMDKKKDNKEVIGDEFEGKLYLECHSHINSILIF